MTVRLHVEREGAGPAVLLAHGFAGSARNWGPQARALRDRCTVLRYDARGHARSEAPSDPAAYAPDLAVGDLAAVLDGAGVSSTVVVGLSMGAAVALRFALAHPERTRALVLAAYPAGREAAGGFSAIAEPFADAIERDGVDAAGARFVWGPASGLDATGAKLVRQGFLEHPPHGLAGTLRGVLGRLESLDDLEPRLRSMTIPMLLIVGDRDAHSIPPSERLARLVPGAELVVVPNAGHVVNLAQPVAFNAALAEFLARHVWS